MFPVSRNVPMAGLPGMRPLVQTCKTAASWYGKSRHDAANICSTVRRRGNTLPACCLLRISLPGLPILHPGGRRCIGGMVADTSPMPVSNLLALAPRPWGGRGHLWVLREYHSRCRMTCPSMKKAQMKPIFPCSPPNPACPCKSQMEMEGKPVRTVARNEMAAYLNTLEWCCR